jgi:1-acyl-sn-glycerol-3-phosphate acyltransferase
MGDRPPAALAGAAGIPEAVASASRGSAGASPSPENGHGSAGKRRAESTASFIHRMFWVHAPDMRRPPEEKQTLSDPVVRLARRTVDYYVNGYHRLKVVGSEHIPDDGPVILASNHVSALDPCLLQVVCRRVIVWMMAREYYESPMGRWFYRRILAIPVDRGGRDMSATRAALRLLQQGRVLGVFPEGRLATDEGLLPFQSGVALLAMHSGAVIIPTCVEGSMRGRGMLEAFVYPARATVGLGKPIAAAHSAEVGRLAALTERVRNEVLLIQQQIRTEDY